MKPFDLLKPCHRGHLSFRAGDAFLTLGRAPARLVFLDNGGKWSTKLEKQGSGQC
jgi:hypothetical protein